MLGRRHAMDMAPGAKGTIGYDAQTKFGAGILYDDGVAFAYVHTPEEGTAPRLAEGGSRRWRTLRASNKDSERFTGNTPVRIVVAQLAPQTQPRNLMNLVSKNLVLRPGNQSIGGT